MRIKTKECYYLFTKMTLLFVLLFINQVAIRGQEQVSAYAPKDGEVYVVANGTGSSKENATYAALRSAIEQTFGTFVSSNTEILDDEVVKDEIISVSSGNVRHYEYISERTGANGTFYVTLRAIVSYAKLAAFVKSKGGAAELSLSSLAANFKIEQFYAENEKKVLENLATQIVEFCYENPIYNYTIEVEKPKTISPKGDVEISYKVTPIINGNAAVVYDLFWNTIKGLAVQKPVDGLGLLQYGTTIMQGIRVFTKNFEKCRNDYPDLVFNKVYRLYQKDTNWLTPINEVCKCYYLVEDNVANLDSLEFIMKQILSANLKSDHFLRYLERIAAVLEEEYTIYDGLYLESYMKAIIPKHTAYYNWEYSSKYMVSFSSEFTPFAKKKVVDEIIEGLIEPAIIGETKYDKGNKIIGDPLPLILHYRINKDISLPKILSALSAVDYKPNELNGTVKYNLEDLSKITGLTVRPMTTKTAILWSLSQSQIHKAPMYDWPFFLYILANKGISDVYLVGGKRKIDMPDKCITIGNLIIEKAETQESVLKEYENSRKESSDFWRIVDMLFLEDCESKQ